MAVFRTRDRVPRATHWQQDAPLLLCMGVLYFAFARLGVSLAFHEQDASLVWPAVGVAVAGILLFGYRAVPAIFAAALLSGLWGGAPLLSAAIVGAGNAAGPALAVALLRRSDFRSTLERARDVVLLLVVGGFAASLVSATVGVVWLTLRGQYAPGTELTHWAVWGAGDVAGLVITAPLFLVWQSWPLWSQDRARVVEFTVLLAAAVGACVLAFTLTGSRALSYPLAYVVFPFAAWAALRFEQHGASVLSPLIITIAVWCTLEGGGPFSSPSVQQTLMHLHAFVVVVGISTLVLAAVTSERRRLLREQQERLEGERQARLEAQKAVAAREKVLAVVSHEVRNPLATTLLNSTLILESAPRESLPSWMKEALEAVVLSAEQIEHVVRDLSDMARLEAGQILLERTAQNPEALIQRVTQMLGPLAEAQGLRLETALSADLPPVLVNIERVLQVFSNVIGNAIRLTPEGGYIRIEGHRVDGTVVFAVLDSGPGLPPGLAADLSGSFWESPLRVDGNQGLGIPIARAIVGAHGGTFRIGGRAEGGARVEFTLPCADEPLRLGLEPEPAPAHTPGGGGRYSIEPLPGT